MKKHVLTIPLAALLTLASVLTFWACQKQTYSDPVDPAVANSAQMEQYVIAGYELQEALRALYQADFSNLTVRVDEKGNKIIQLPVQALIFEHKLNALNDRKDDLLQKYPHLTSISQEERTAHLEYCLEHSVAVATKLLDMGIHNFLPSKQDSRPENSFLDYNGMMDSLGRWVRNPFYVEALAIGYKGGGFDIYIDARNDSLNSFTPPIHHNSTTSWWRGGSFPNTPIETMIHTQRASEGGLDASKKDSTALRFPGVTYQIFYNGTLKDF